MEHYLKRCPSCGETKPANDFYKAGKKGLAGYCKLCERQKKYGIARDVPIRDRAAPVIAPEGMKHCYACGANKPFDDFPVDRQKSDGRDAYCKSCRIEKSRAFDMKPRPINPLGKVCQHCREFKPLSEFYRAKTEYDGLNKICKKCSKSWKDENRPARINAVLKYKYNAPHGTYERLLAKQDGKCAICALPPKKGKRLGLDHCHATNKIRGLLCDKCNFAIGAMNDSEKYLLAAIEYLRKHR